MKSRYLLVASIAVATVAVDIVTVAAGLAVGNAVWTQAIPNTVGVVVGLVIVARGRASRMGWMVLIAFGSILMTQFVIVSEWMLFNGNEGAAAWWGFTFGSTSGPGPVGIAALAPIVLLAGMFPSGHFEPGWRWFPWTLGIVLAAAVVIGVVSPVVVSGETLRHPLLGDGAVTALRGATDVFLLAATILLLAAVIGMIGRLRRSDPVARQQIKWFVYGVGVYVATLVLIFGVLDHIWSENAAIVADSIGFSALPLSLGLAVMRYRLFEVDRLISRTVAYALVIAVLAGAFALVATVPSIVFASGEVESWQIALGTLAVAALFNPLRLRLQRVVDRRFDRAHYDAQRVVDRLGANMQEGLDGASIRTEVARAVDRVVRPQSVAVWLSTGDDLLESAHGSSRPPGGPAAGAPRPA